MKRTRIAWLALAAVVPLALGGCRTIHHIVNEDSCNKPQPYQRATSIPPLDIPGGLNAPDTSHALDVPPLNEPAPPARRRGEPCLAAPPPFNVPHPNAVPEA